MKPGDLDAKLGLGGGKTKIKITIKDKNENENSNEKLSLDQSEDKDKDEDKKAAARKNFVDRCVRDVKERHKVTSCDLSLAVLHSLLLWTR